MVSIGIPHSGKALVNLKLWLDDIRTPPDTTWLWVRSYDEAIKAIDSAYFDIISLDHDLGMVVLGEGKGGILVGGEVEAKTGYDVACYLERRVFSGEIAAPNRILSHSANPVGRRRIEQVAKRLTELL